MKDERVEVKGEVAKRKDGGLKGRKDEEVKG